MFSSSFIGFHLFYLKVSVYYFNKYGTLILTQRPFLFSSIVYCFIYRFSLLFIFCFITNLFFVIRHKGKIRIILNTAIIMAPVNVRDDMPLAKSVLPSDKMNVVCILSTSFPCFYFLTLLSTYQSQSGHKTNTKPVN